MENLNAYQIALEQFDRAAARLKLEHGLAEILRHPKRQLAVSVPIRMDDGSVRVFEGFRVQHNLARGPAKRFSLFDDTLRRHFLMFLVESDCFGALEAEQQ